MDREDRTAAAARILDGFARSSGIEGEAAPRRYLWTDALAVCTWLSLHGRTGDAVHGARARALVDQVHGVLGRHRADDERSGWISGLGEGEGARHPTRGGLRIGKQLPERGVHDAYDAELEWDRDGQYYHYLTKWMHALHRMAIATGETRYHRWAAELAATAHARFMHGAPGARRLVWKMSVDLGRVLVPSPGHHDPLDGLITFLALQASPARDADAPDLGTEVRELDALCQARSWATDDPLGIGGLLTDALRVAQLVAGGAHERESLLQGLCADAAASLTALARRSPLDLPLEDRLPFRELGLALGLRAVSGLRDLWERGLVGGGLGPWIATLDRHVPLAAAIEEDWRQERARRVRTWTEHEDINAVTLAAALAPEGFLGI